MNQHTFKPAEDRVAIKPHDPKKETASGLYLPDPQNTEPKWGTIVAIGPGRYDANGKVVPMRSRPGDVVAYVERFGMELKDSDGTKYFVIREPDLLGAWINRPEIKVAN